MFDSVDNALSEFMILLECLPVDVFQVLEPFEGVVLTWVVVAFYDCPGVFGEIVTNYSQEGGDQGGPPGFPLRTVDNLNFLVICRLNFIT